MKLFEKIMRKRKYLPLLCLTLLLVGCSQFNELYKKRPTVALSLPKASTQEAPMSVPRDSVVERPKDIVFVRATGEEVPLNVNAEWDSIYKENITGVTLDEVVISGQTRRNTAERDGKISVEFIVTVPREFQRDNWMVDVFPILRKGEVTRDSLKEIRFTGAEFRQKQESDYRRYDRFLEGIIPDSVNFYRTFVNYHSFERYLDRLNFKRQSLKRSWALLDAKIKRPDPVLLRFEKFNLRMAQHDSLFHLRMMKKADRRIKWQWEHYAMASKKMADTVRYLHPHMLERFRYFNNKGDGWMNRANAYTVQRREQLLHRFDSDSARYERAMLLGDKKTMELIERKRYFHDVVTGKEMWMNQQAMYGGLSKPLSDRFSFFNQRMENYKGKLYRYYRVRAARKEGGEQLNALKAFVAGKDTASYLDRDGLLKKYMARYEKVRDLLPMFNYERPLDDSAYLASRHKKLERQKKLSEFSESNIRAHYAGRVKPLRLMLPEDTVYRPSFFERLSTSLPVYEYRRELPDSTYYIKPSKKVMSVYKAAQFDPDETVAFFQEQYEKKRKRTPRYNMEREMVNVLSRKEQRMKKLDKIQANIDRLSSLDSTKLVKNFYNTQKIARNAARVAQKDEKFRDLVRFPYNPGAKLDTVIYAADKVYYLYSEKIAADENTSRLYVHLEGAVVDHVGNEYRLPTSDTLTYFVSSMTKFVDETPRYIQRVVTRDAEASTKVNFIFPSGKSKLDRSLGENGKELTRVKELTSALMTDPVYIIDSLTLYAGSSPEGNWAVNERLSRERAASIKEVMENDFKQLYDSLNISVAMIVDDQGNITTQKTAGEELPNLPKLLRVKSTGENWAKLAGLIQRDDKIEHREQILDLIEKEKRPDEREYAIRRKYPKDYAYMREKLYPEVRSVDFLFNLHRRGMQKDTVYSTEIDENYAAGVELLKKRKYAEALEILRPYEDINTAIAYMSQQYDRAAIRILNAQRETADVRYLQAVLEYRLGDEREAVLRYMRACEMNPQLKFRGNLDPELSTLIKKYDLFKEDDEW